MYRTQKHAAECWCPFGRKWDSGDPDGPHQGQAAAVNDPQQITDGSVTPAAKCIGARCMAWRWAKSVVDVNGHLVGFCGLAGVPLD